MNPAKKSVTLWVVAVLLLLEGGWAGICDGQKLALTPFDATGIYRVGDRVGWTVAFSDGGKSPGEYSFVVRRDNLEVIQSGKLDLTSGRARIELTADEPEMLYLAITGPGSSGAPVVAGAAVAPERLEPVVARPADFDEFWQGKIKLLEQIAPNVVLTPKESGRADIEYATITMDQINGVHVHGQIAKPRRAGKFPALVLFQYAGPPYPLPKSNVILPAERGWLVLNIEPHDVLPDQPKAYYAALPAAIKSYQSIGNDDREKSYFLQMYLADYRAVDYVASRGDWDGKTLVVMGTSMGGQQSLCVAGLNRKVTQVIVDEPSGCDTNGPLHGRQSGYPNFPANNAKIMRTALYFDAVNFAPHITATSLVAMGFVDTTAPPAGIWTAFNEIKGPKEAVPMIDSPHNNLATAAEQMPFTRRSTEWLGTLVRGEEVKPAALAANESGTEPVERTDGTSRLAHEALLRKAKQGGIDIYFEGDSITRRWGCSDRQYTNLLANWRSNFFGWNAGDFGWGGDTVQNILWRVENGELDGVHPKIIVLLAGTNNIGTRPAGDEKVAEVSAAMKRLIEVCRAKAPGATIIVTGIFPRNDNQEAMGAINAINGNLAKLADGKAVRYININDKLADASGRLFAGMMNRDKLHPTVKTYQIWADALKPIFAEILGPPAGVDHAPAPTGDPSAK